MVQEANALRTFDKSSIATLEAGFLAGPLSEALAGSPEIPRRRGLSVQQFDRDYRQQKQPIVIEGLVDDWPAIKKWNFQHLGERCGSTVVTVDGYNREKAREITVNQFIQMLNATPGNLESPAYIQEWYYKETAPLLTEDLPELDIAQYDLRRNLYGEKLSTSHQLWIGQQGGVTMMHQDSYVVDVIHVQIVGEKKWFVMSPAATLHRTPEGKPDFERLVGDPDTRLMCCTLKPGEVLYLPALWWHRVVLLSDSIGMGIKCLDESNLQAHIRQRMAELLCLAC